MGERPIKLLLVDDDDDDYILTRDLLSEIEGGRFHLERVAAYDAALEAIAGNAHDCYLIDYRLGERTGLDLLRQALANGCKAPMILLTGQGDRKIDVEAMKAGAADYLVKGQIDAPLLERSIRYAIERHWAKEMIQHHASYDGLTNLPNRNFLYDCLQQAIFNAEQENKTFALLVMDLDRFKDVNDTLGHQTGDLLLHQVGPRVKESLRESDMLARLGGDEFAVLLPAPAGADRATEVARKILKALEEPFVIAGLKLNVEASIGIALFPQHGADADTLIKRADVAMYVAKETRSGCAVYSAEQDQSSAQRLLLMGELRSAIVQDQLFLLYQPKINLKTGQAAGVEALVRWQHPRFGVMPPDQFIPLAERTGLIMPLTLWVLHKALQQCHAWHEAGLKISVAVNLSRQNLHAPELPDQILGILKSCGVSPADLDLEITESAIMANPVRAGEVLARMKGIGLRLSLDDFGTGHSSLAYLKKLPVNELKIDKSFIMNMMSDERDVAIARLIIELGHTLGLKVVAEGVENQETMNALISLGCDMAQGYHISRPIPAEELTGWLWSPPTFFFDRNRHAQANTQAVNYRARAFPHR